MTEEQRRLLIEITDILVMFDLSDQYIWTIDKTSDKYNWRYDVEEFFDMELFR